MLVVLAFCVHGTPRDGEKLMYTVLGAYPGCWRGFIGKKWPIFSTLKTYKMGKKILAPWFWVKNLVVPAKFVPIMIRYGYWLGLEVF